MTTNNEKREALVTAARLLGAAGNPSDAAIVAEVANTIKPDKPSKPMTCHQFTNFVLSLVDLTDQDAGGNLSAADFLQEICDAIDIQGVNIPWEPAIHSTKVDIDLSDPAWNEDDGKGEPDGSEEYYGDFETGESDDEDRPPIGPKEWLDKGVIPPHNVPDDPPF